MRIKYEDGYIKANLYDLVEGVPPEGQRELADTLACRDAIIEHVAQQIISGWTEYASHGSSGIEAEGEPSTALDKAWRDVAKASGDVARREVERLEAALLSAEKRQAKTDAELGRLRHKWNDWER